MKGLESAVNARVACGFRTLRGCNTSSKVLFPILLSHRRSSARGLLVGSISEEESLFFKQRVPNKGFLSKILQRKEYEQDLLNKGFVTNFLEWLICKRAYKGQCLHDCFKLLLSCQSRMCNK